MPTQEQLVQWLPGIAVVAVAAFPGLFLLRKSLLVRLVAASATVIATLFLFGLMLGHQFHFARAEDIPVLLLGMLVAWLAAVCARALRAVLSHRARAEGGDGAA
jgi:hypothetical protein